MIRLGGGSKRFWRPLVGVVVAYTVAAQSLLIALGGLTLAAHTNEGRRLSSFVSTAAKGHQKFRPVTLVIPGAPIASSALPDRITF